MDGKPSSRATRGGGGAVTPTTASGRCRAAVPVLVILVLAGYNRLSGIVFEPRASDERV
jgi:hypothetical protein